MTVEDTETNNPDKNGSLTSQTRYLINEVPQFLSITCKCWMLLYPITYERRVCRNTVSNIFQKD